MKREKNVTGDGNKAKNNLAFLLIGLAFLGGAMLLMYFGFMTIAHYDVSTLSQSDWPNSIMDVFKLFVFECPMLFFSVVLFFVALIFFIQNVRSEIKGFMLIGSLCSIVVTMGVIAFLAGIIAIFFEPTLLWYLVSLNL